CLQLQGGNVEERECAACIMANLAKNSESCGSLLDASVIRTAAPLLVDQNCAVRHSIAGALRNISAINHEACSTLVEYDVMTPLVALLKEYNCDWRPAQTRGKIDSKSEIFCEAVHLLWNLCESSETSVSIFNKERLWSVLLPCLNITKYGANIATAVGHCLHAVSEDNSELAEGIGNLELLESAFQDPSEEPANILVKVLASGILLNLAETEEGTSTVSPALVVSVLVSALSLPVLEAITTLAQIVAEVKGFAKKKNLDMQFVEEKEKALEECFNIVSNTLTAKQTALEILSNLCCAEEAGSKDDEYEDSDDSAEVFDGDMDVEDTSAVFPLNISCEFHEVLVKQNIVSKVTDHVNKLDDKIASTLSEHKLAAAVPKRVHAVRCRALLCIANLAQSLDPQDLGGPAGLVNTWTCLAQLAFVHMNPKDLELLEASTSACRSVLQALAAAVGSGDADQTTLPNVSDEELKVLSQVGLQCSEGAVRTNVTRIMATLGCLLRDPQPELLKKVGQYLLEVALKDSDIMVMTEALDATFDAFAEDATDPIAAEIELVPKLKLVLPAFRTKINQMRKSLGKHYPVVMTAKTNLVRFLKYKSRREQLQNGKAG
ncbi:unnamed protein product, partial [Ixodes hexagonus]